MSQPTNPNDQSSETLAIIVSYKGSYTSVLQTKFAAASIGVSTVYNGGGSDSLSQHSTYGNVGYGTAVNIGFKRSVQSNTRWLIIANDDAIPSSFALEWIGSTLQSLPQDIGVIGFHDGEIPDDPGYRRLFPSVAAVLWTLRLGERRAKDLHPEACYPSGAFFAIRRSLFDDLGGFDTDFFLYFEETDLFYRALSNGWKICWAPTAASIAHTGGGSTRSAYGLTSLESGRSAAIYARKRGWRFTFTWLPFWTVLVAGLGLRAAAQRQRLVAFRHSVTLIGIVIGSAIPWWEPLKSSRLRAVGRQERRVLGFVPTSRCP
jgi:N-acetylglucosaminyl-diphospho-decaprenol L-rhamnosyltransferase